MDHHWREIQRKAKIKGHVLVVRAVDDILADLRQKAAVKAAVAEAIEPLQATIDTQQQQVREL